MNFFLNLKKKKKRGQKKQIHLDEVKKKKEYVSSLILTFSFLFSFFKQNLKQLIFQIFSKLNFSKFYYLQTFKRWLASEHACSEVLLFFG